MNIRRILFPRMSRELDELKRDVAALGHQDFVVEKAMRDHTRRIGVLEEAAGLHPVAVASSIAGDTVVRLPAARKSKRKAPKKPARKPSCKPAISLLSAKSRQSNGR